MTHGSPSRSTGRCPTSTGVTCRYGAHAGARRRRPRRRRGEFIGIVGPVRLRQDDAAARAARRGLARSRAPSRAGPACASATCPQVETVNWNFPVTVERVRADGAAPAGRSAAVAQPRRAGRGRTTCSTGSASADLADRHIRELSGGQQQRVFIARALLGRPELLLLDEPTSGVDVRTRHEVLHLLGDLNDDGLAIVLTTHDLNGIAAHLPHLVCLNREIIGEGTPDEVLTADVLERTYGAPMDVLEHGGMPIVVDRYAHDNVDPAAPDARRDAGRAARAVPVRVLPPRPHRRDHRRRAVRAARRLRRAARHELHRPRPVARDLRRRSPRAPLLGVNFFARRRPVGPRLGAHDRPASPAGASSAPTPPSA